ncbi:MBL fold metallo-hydrolase [Legionella yabuuchiae]|uniref:MBL fold metallo-hydrolase n=1 Tax=Legionella yabuuchiae TaxID=376727 RepID=UPI00105679D3|nr:MBL fold metallo-hydrolase [Legionella yabuuchiae]
MLFRQLFDHDSFTYTYLIARNLGSDAVIIDPVKSKIDQYLNLIKQLGLNLVAALDTHLHADHITALGTLNRVLGCESMMGEQSQASGVTKRFHDHELLRFDGFELQVLYTPGHTDDSYCFLMNDRVFTGDTLFIRGTGRTDFQHGDSSQQYSSIHERLFSLPDETLVYPGHDYNGMTVSTIGEEKLFNPRLKGISREQYVTLMAGLNLPNPKLMHIAVPANQNCGVEKD